MERPAESGQAGGSLAGNDSSEASWTQSMTSVCHRSGASRLDSVQNRLGMVDGRPRFLDKLLHAAMGRVGHRVEAHGLVACLADDEVQAVDRLLARRHGKVPLGGRSGGGNVAITNQGVPPRQNREGRSKFVRQGVRLVQ